uniref:Uncharacterized protein n=1 Tax=Panagrolaimus sp. PS1159 TaxID=55785 RepID=A0AC35FIB0_9BILA
MSNHRFRFDANAPAYQPCAAPPATRASNGGPPPGGPPGHPSVATASNSWRVVQPPTTSPYYTPHTTPPFTVPQPTYAYAPTTYVTSTGAYMYTPMATPYYVSTPNTATTEYSRFAYSRPAPQCQLLYPQHTGAFQTSTPASFFSSYIAPPPTSTNSGPAPAFPSTTSRHSPAPTPPSTTSGPPPPTNSGPAHPTLTSTTPGALPTSTNSVPPTTTASPHQTTDSSTAKMPTSNT